MVGYDDDQVGFMADDQPFEIFTEGRYHPTRTPRFHVAVQSMSARVTQLLMTRALPCRKTDVLNLGVSPALLIERAKERFLTAGGTIREKTAVDGITVHSNGAALHVKDTGLK